MFSPSPTARRQEPPASQRSPRAPVSLQVSSIVPETTDDTARPKAFPLATSLALAGDVFSAALVLALPFCKATGGRFYQKNLQGMYGQWLLNNIFSIMFPKAHVKKINKIKRVGKKIEQNKWLVHGLLGLLNNSPGERHRGGEAGAALPITPRLS